MGIRYSGQPRAKKDPFTGREWKSLSKNPLVNNWHKK